jgi:hypothetical protein
LNSAGFAKRSSTRKDRDCTKKNVWDFATVTELPNSHPQNLEFFHISRMQVVFAHVEGVVTTSPAF